MPAGPSYSFTPSGTVDYYGNPYHGAGTIPGAQQGGLMSILGYPGTRASVTGQPGPSGGSVQGAATGPAPAPAPAVASPDDLSFLSDQEAQLRALLGRTDTALNQGLTRNEDAYNTEVGNATTDKNRQVQGQTKAKLGAYDTINRNASTGYRSLAQIIGRASGTGSSAFRELLPDVIGKDTSSKRQAATNTFGENLSNIDTSFESVINDLLKQKKANEEDVRGGVEAQRQSINDQLARVAAQEALAKGGGYAEVKAAQSPFQEAINKSRDLVEGLFNTFRTPFTPPTVNPNLATYQTDRSVVNAQSSPDGGDATNPYAALLRKRLKGIA